MVLFSSEMRRPRAELPGAWAREAAVPRAASGSGRWIPKGVLSTSRKGKKLGRKAGRLACPSREPIWFHVISF
jgi:hypothetical protein